MAPARQQPQTAAASSDRLGTTLQRGSEISQGKLHTAANVWMVVLTAYPQSLTIAANFWTMCQGCERLPYDDLVVKG